MAGGGVCRHRWRHQVIAKVTEKIVPFMAHRLLCLSQLIAIIALNAERNALEAIGAIFSGKRS